MSVRIKIKEIKDILRVDRRFARIVDIDSRGRVIYQVGYYADIANAIAKNAIKVRISVYSTNPRTKSSLFRDVTTGHLAINRIRRRVASRKQQIKKLRSRLITRTYSDISSGISNSVAMKIRKHPRSANKILGTRKVLRAIKTSKLESSQLKTRPAMGISKIKSDDVVKAKSVRLGAIRSIIKDGVDPSTVGRMSFPLISSQQAHAGTSKVTEPRAMRLRKKRNQRVKNTKGFRRAAQAFQAKKGKTVAIAKKTQNAKIINSFFQKDRRKKAKSLSSIPLKSHTVVVEIPARWKGFEETVKLPRHRLKGVGRLYFLFELLGEKGEVVDQEIRKVNHSLAIKKYFTPKIAPTIEVTGGKIGINKLMVKQNDPIATKIRVYRRQLNPNDSSISRKYEFVSEFKTIAEDGDTSFDDLVNNTSVCIYRAVAVGPRGIKGRRFRNAIAKAIPIPERKATPNLDLSHVSIFAETSGDVVRIRVANIPEGPCALYVIATDKTAQCPTRQYVGHCRTVGSDIESQIQLVGEESGELFFEDPAVKHRHIYEYSCVLIYPSGNETHSKVKELHQFLKKPEDENILVIATDPVVTADEDGDVEIGFEINANFTESGFSGIVSALEASGIEGDYITEVRSNREKLESLLALEVLRQDNISGLTETFSVVPNGSSFVDSPTSRALAGVSDPAPGRSYRYIATACVRNPGTLIPTTSDSQTDITTNKKYVQRVYKFFNPLSLDEGTLPSTARSMGKTMKSPLVSDDPFLQGKTAISTSVDAIVPSQRSVIDNVTVSKDAVGENTLTWSVSGDPDEIDHFLILAEFEGVKSTIGTVHNISDSSKYQFTDDELASQIGTVEYSILPVFSDYTYGAETDPVSITLENEMPSFALGL